METIFSDITDSILRCAIAVHREIGPGLQEYSYQTAIELELAAAGIQFISKRPIIVRYRGVVVGWHVPDLIVEDKVIVELKSISNFDPVHTKQVLTYLKLTNLRVALLLNFGVSSLGNAGIKRVQL